MGSSFARRAGYIILSEESMQRSGAWLVRAGEPFRFPGEDIFLGKKIRPSALPAPLFRSPAMNTLVSWTVRIGGGFREWVTNSSEEAATNPGVRQPFRVRPKKPGSVQTISWVSQVGAGFFIKLEPLVERRSQGRQLELQDRAL